MKSFITYISILISSLGFPAIIVLLLLNPEKIEKWSSLLWKFLSLFGGLFKSAHKRYVKHDLQSRVNEFTRGLRKDAPGLAPEKLVIEYIDSHIDRNSFISDGKIIIRLKRQDPQDHNFVHGVYHYVSRALLSKAKRYLAPSQREAIDLYVCAKIIEKEKPTVSGYFLDEYLHPKTSDSKSKVSGYVDDFVRIDDGGLFFPVFVQEIHYIGDKVFGRRRDDLVHLDVNGLIPFLRKIAERTVGDDKSDLDYHGTYCRFAIVIVGKRLKVQASIEPYVGFINKTLLPSETETIYLLSPADNHKYVEAIVDRFSGNYECVRRARFKGAIRYPDRKESTHQYIAVLRKQGIAVVQPSVS